MTVHHKDHNHDNNPLDGSNWELLCIYCHEYEHAKFEDARWYSSDKPDREEANSTYNPFTELQKMMDEKNK